MSEKPSPLCGGGCLRSRGERGRPFPEMALPSSDPLTRATFSRKGEKGGTRDHCALICFSIALSSLRP